MAAPAVADPVHECQAYARSGYIETDRDRAGCGVRLSSMLSVNVAGHASVDTGVIDDARLQPDFFDADGDSYLLLGEASLAYAGERVTMKLGRQVYDTPHFDADDLRMVPNLFEVYGAGYSPVAAVDAGIAFVRTMSDWENRGDQAEFRPISDAYGGRGDDAGAVVGTLQYAPGEASVAAWAYHLFDVVDILYVEAAWGRETAAGTGYRFALQGDLGRETGAARIGAVAAATIGGMAEVSHGPFRVELAWNQNLGGTPALASLGAGPFYTSMEDTTLDLVPDADAYAVVGTLE